MPSTPKMPIDSGNPMQPGASEVSVDALDFDRSDRSARVCARCETPIADRYYTIGSHLLCEACQLAFRSARAPGNAASRFLGAAALGVLAAAIGCGLWMLVTQLTGYEIGLIAIVVGYLVGMAVHVGARRVGGVCYQLLAVFLTYSAIVMTYVPVIANELIADDEFQRQAEIAASEPSAEGGDPNPTSDERAGEHAQSPVADPVETAAIAWLAAVPIAYAVPFLMGFENIIGILIIGFALWQAFRMNARAKIDLQGPFRLEVRDPALG